MYVLVFHNRDFFTTQLQFKVIRLLGALLQKQLMSHLFSDSFLHVEITEEGLSLTGKEKEHPRVSRKEEGFLLANRWHLILPLA